MRKLTFLERVKLLLNRNVTTFESGARALINRETTYGQTFFRELEPRIKIACFNKEPRIRKAIIKKANNVFGHWFEIDSPIDGVDVAAEIEQKIKEFNKEVNLKGKLIQHYINQCVFGVAYLELTTSEVIGEHGEGLEKPLVGLKNIYNVDPRVIEYKTVKGEEAKRVNRFQKPLSNVEYFVMRRGKDRILVHPSRLIRTEEYKVGDEKPVGVIDVAYNIILSVMNADKSLGEVLYRFGHPFPAVTIKDATDEELDAVSEALSNLSQSTGFVGDDRYTFQLLNPSSFSPDEFSNYFYIALSCAMQMPLLLLLGVQKGALTGSEVDLADYYNDIKCIQEIVFTPVLNKIYTQLLGDDWKYEIYWNPIYIDEKSEAEIRLKNVEALKMLYYDMGIIDDVTARQIARRWGIPIPEALDFETEGEEALERKNEIKVRAPTDEELRFAEYYRKLGEKELKEQEERLKNAKRADQN